MPYIVTKSPDVQIDLMVRGKYWPKLVNIFCKTRCSYHKERWIEKKNGQSFVLIRDVKSNKGYQIGELLGHLYGLEWEALTDSENKEPQKFYILIRPRRSGKHGDKNRQKIGSGSKGGDRGKPAGNSEPRQDPGSGGSCDQPGVSGSDHIWSIENQRGDDFDGDHYSN